MGVPEIPRKEVAAPAPAHLKEIESQNTMSTDSGWDLPDERQRKRRIGLGGASSARWAVQDRVDRVLPPHKRYFGRSRRTLFIAITVSFICLLALIIGLAVGLHGGSKKIQDLPLPKGSEVYTGDLTYYGTGLGACGIPSTDNDDIVAISHYVFDAAQKGSDPNANPLCGRKIRIKRVDERTGKSVSADVTVVDRCVGCQPKDLDVSPAVFKKLANPDLGRVLTTWAWL